MASSVASVLNAIARNSGFYDSESLGNFIADYFGGASEEYESYSGEPSQKCY